jgi:hypothetical protein
MNEIKYCKQSNQRKAAMPKVSKHKRRKDIILFGILAAALAAGSIYFLLAGRTRTPATLVTETPDRGQTVASLPEPLSQGQEAWSSFGGTDGQPAAGAGETASVPMSRQELCSQSYRQIAGFFSQLDERGFSSGLPVGSERHFAELTAKLSASPPVLTRETDSLSSLLRNTTHMYRVLGRSNVILIRGILEKEADNMEAALVDFHHWSRMSTLCSGEEYPFRLPLEDIYPYAGFFLNSLGGQAYLSRRPPGIRTLVRYYSVLILDEANEQGLNTYGIDIRPAIDSLIGDMEALRNLSGQEHYLQVLQNLNLKYLSRYGRF